AVLETAAGPVNFVRLAWLAENGSPDPSRLPHTVKILLENLLRRAGTQDVTGVPAVVDLAALRSAVARAGGDASSVDPQVPVDLIIDHSVQVDLFRSAEAY